MPKYMEFEVTLAGTKPRVWRRFMMRAHGRSMLDLHYAIQDACGWEEAHLWSFRELKAPRKTIATIPDQGEMSMGIGPIYSRREPQAHMVSLKQVFKEPRDKCDYWYDFGDDWHHTVVLKKIIDSEEKFERRLTAGALAFPPEDCGGLWGYYACVAATAPEGILSESDLAEFRANDNLEDRKEWLTDIGWRPDAFDLASANQAFEFGHDSASAQE